LNQVGDELNDGVCMHKLPTYITFIGHYNRRRQGF